MAEKRVDAVKNYEHILRVAHDAFARDGATSLNVIAKSAGVGPGTLYRHFPTREALVLAVYRHDVERLAARVENLLADHQPLDAFRLWFETFADYVRCKHGLAAAMHTVSYPPVTAAVETLLKACERNGDVRPGLDPADVLLLMGFLWRAGDDRTRARVMDLAITGFRS
jgi:AcrR family transcriptional regulator